MIAAIALLVVGARPARAESEADRLFREGRAAVDRGDYTDACAKFERSFALDPKRPGGGLVGNLAECQEHSGHLGRAWKLWNDAALRFDRAGDPGKVKFARDHANAVAEHATTVVIGVPDPTAPGLTISVNGERVAAAGSIRIVVDPGDIAVEATATGAEPFHRTRAGARAGETVVVEIRLVYALRPSERRRSRIHLAWGLGAGAAAAGIAGLSFALVGNARYDRAVRDDCGGDVTSCSPAGATKVNAARHLADVGTDFGIAAGLLVSGAAVVYLTAPRDVVIVPTPNGVGLVLSRSF
jgi:hypothetical protein